MLFDSKLYVPKFRYVLPVLHKLESSSILLLDKSLSFLCGSTTLQVRLSRPKVVIF